MREDLLLFNSIVEELLKQEQENPVSIPIKAKELYNKLDLSLADDPCINEEFTKVLKDLVSKTPRTASNRFFNQLWGGRNSKAVLGDLLAVMLNTSMATYKVAGPQIGIEKEIIAQICKLIGYNNNSDGTFPVGGSMGNFMALIMARDKKDLEIRNNGLSKKMIAYTSSESHYSNAKNMSFSGLGRHNLHYINCNEKGEMIPKNLEEKIKEDIANGFVPFYVNATAGTTVLGAFDPVKELSNICKKYKIWLHVDGAYQGAVIFSSKYKHLLEGIENSDSFSFNAHKMLGTPLTCSILLIKDKKHLFNSFNNTADYLYQTDLDDYNLGKTSFQCGRRNDALKFWTLWKAVGTNGLANIVEHLFETSKIARNYVRNNSNYTLYSFNNSLSVCFNYKDYDAIDLCTKLYESQKLLVGYGSFKGEAFVRLVTINAENKETDILNFFNILEDFVRKNENLIRKKK
ncbi:MAG: aminotransferase class V-fold PLP-dependent enzyme [Flavobacteriales bacterium]|nr:aminotransferase class V-fold PLP-dependent enzyme [Flavobacteriales bacterium]